MSKQDRQGVRTPSDLERKYDFGQLSGNNSHKAQSEKINQLTQLLSQFMAETTAKLAELDKSSTTWFYSGAPTLENLPAVEWTTDALKEKHIGDFYYDEDGSGLYLFKRTEDSYAWVLC